MSVAQMTGILAVVAFASAVSRVSGFGFGLIVVPVMSVFVAPQKAVIIASILGLVTSWYQAWTERVHADMAVARRLFAGACLGMPFGLAVFLLVPANGLRLVLGAVVIVSALLLARGFALLHPSSTLDVVVGAVSGVLNTSVSTNGPPLVFLLQARGYDPHRFRGTISRVFALSNVVSMAMFLLAGRVTADAGITALVAVPVVVIAQIASTRLVAHVHGGRFRLLVLVLLFASGVSAIAAGLFH